MMYIPLNIKTEYDLMNSLIKIDDLCLYAQKNNINALGITDTHMFGTMEFINKCKAYNIKPIVGIELNVESIRIYLYAKNYEGYVSLCKIVSHKNEKEITFEYINSYFKDIICVCSYKDYNNLSKYSFDIYIMYSSDEEKKNALVLSNNVVYMYEINYIYESDSKYFKYIKLINDGKTINDDISYYESFIKENNNTDDIKSTYEFSSLINIIFPKVKEHIPVYKENSLSYLKALSKKGLDKRLNGHVPESYKNRLVYELSVIEKMHYVDYFLIVYDFVLFAKKHNILVGPGRGSGAASLVNYSLGIINVDPIKYDLIFERFLNPDRITMPDIDIDFDNTKREDVIDYVISKYGVNNTARIISFNTMLPKQVIRDVGKVLSFDGDTIDRLCKTIKDEKDFVTLKNNKDFMNLVTRNNEVKNMVIICNKLCGLKKNTSIHAAGVVISDIELDSIMPLYKSDNVILTGYSMEYIESLGLLKMDFLSIKNLNTISNIIDEIKNNGIDIDINSIDLNDYKTLNLFRNAYTTGIFQFESMGMKNFLHDLEVDNFNTLVDAIALYRPGPREMISTYIRRKKHKEKTVYTIDILEPILKNTYGIIIYQEQVLEILKRVGGYTYAEADIIRRAMSKKKYDVIDSQKGKFVKGVTDKCYSEKQALELYDLIIKFSSYGFNKSHSVVYSLVAFQMAYLKTHFTSYFMKNLLNMNKGSEKLKEYIDESKLLGLEFESIDINSSEKEFYIKNNKLILPFTIIKNISSIVCDEIIIKRNNCKFKSFYDFMIRCYGKTVNRRVVVSLIECGVFDSFNLNKKETINNLNEIINYVSLCNDLNMTLDTEPVLEKSDEFSDKENIDNEINNYGFYLSYHPVTKYDRSSLITLETYKKYFDKTITSILFLESIKTIRTKNNDKMSFVKLSDEYDTVEGVIFSDSLNKFEALEKNNVYKVIAKVEKRNNTFQLIIYNMIRLV